MVIKPGDHPVVGEVHVDGSPVIIVADKKVVYNSDMPISFDFQVSGLTLSARLPSMNASGLVTFDQLDVHAALYMPLGGIVQKRAQIKGSVKCDTMYITDQFTIFSKFRADGDTFNLEVKAKPTIPWAEVLSSPYNIAFNAFFFTGMVILVVRKRKANRLLHPQEASPEAEC
jgi:hypothetical protein